MRQGAWYSILLLLAVSFSYLFVSLAAPDPPIAQAQTLTFGLIPEQNVFLQKKRYQFVCDYLSRQMNVEIKTRILTSYGQAVDEFRQGKVDGAFLGSYLSAVILKLFPTSVLARPVWLDGTSSYKGVIIALKDSGIDPEVQSWKGLSIGMVHTYTSAYLFPLDLLHRQGYPRAENFFGKIKMYGSHDAVVFAVMEGKVDLGACKNTILKQLRATNPQFEAINVLAQSEDFPSNGLIVRDAVPKEHAEKLKTLLLTMHESPEGKQALEAFSASKFIETELTDYDAVFEFMDRLEIKPVLEPPSQDPQ